VDWSFVWHLAVPGMLGGAVGAYLLTALPSDAIRPLVNAYLLLMGAWILWKALRSSGASADEPPRWIVPLGLGGGGLPTNDQVVCSGAREPGPAFKRLLGQRHGGWARRACHG
jgi:hypothetical protein